MELNKQQKEAKQKAIDKWNLDNKKCPNCNKRIPFEKRRNKFCNHSCSMAYINRTSKRKYFPKKCPICDKEFTDQKNTCCSKECRKEYNYRVYIEKWLKGTESGNNKHSISPYVRRYLFNKNSNKCQICGWSKKNKYSGNIPLEVEHKDGDCFNSKENNLMLLCPNCHSLTRTYKALNYRKSKRTYRLGSLV